MVTQRIPRRALWLLMALGAGCGGGSPRGASAADGVGVAAGTPTAGSTRAASTTAGFSCPPTLAEASRLLVECGEGSGPECAYPDGGCFCGAPRQCGGAYLEPQPPVWQCPRADLPPCPDYP